MILKIEVSQVEDTQNICHMSFSCTILKSYFICKIHSKRSKAPLVLFPWNSNKNIFSTVLYPVSCLPLFRKHRYWTSMWSVPFLNKKKIHSLKSQENSSFHYFTGRINQPPTLEDEALNVKGFRIFPKRLHDQFKSWWLICLRYSNFYLQ